MVILMMGVSGSGKTTIGRALAKRLAWVFLDADDDHSPASVEKMRNGIPLTDADRAPWLAAVGKRVQQHEQRGEDVVLACSALKASYRETLRGYTTEMAIVFLTAPPRLLKRRIADRKEHFMHANMLTSQLDTLEPPSDAVVIDASASPDHVVDAILAQLPVKRRAE